MNYAIAMDLGTSGFRAQAIDLSSGGIVSTAITTHHPLPGVNVIDHIHFTLETGVDTARDIIISAVNNVISRLRIPLEEVDRLAVCGNPIQLSLFQGIEIRDLAWAGQRKLEAMGVEPVKRDAKVMTAEDIPGLNLSSSCDVVVPPAVSHHVGADALAMIIKTGMLERTEISLAIDYGTNAEMALFHEGRVITGSTAAGPALEGQRISRGMLAAPGAISDLNTDSSRHRLVVLDSEMLPAHGAIVDFRDSGIMRKGDRVPVGITGTGTIAIVNQAMETGLITLPRINTSDHRLHLSEGIWFSEEDLFEAGKAFGAVRAGYVTLCGQAGIAPENIHTAYMSGASGTYVDPRKAQGVGMVPPRVKTVCQVGNTSLSMARDLAMDIRQLDRMSTVAEKLRDSHCVFASSKTFQRIYILELSYWTEGMPLSMYRKFLKKYRFPDLLSAEGTFEIIRTVERDIDELGTFGLAIVRDIGETPAIRIEDCTSCMACVEECPSKALSMTGDAAFGLDPSLCEGLSCRRCEHACPQNSLRLDDFFDERYRHSDM